MKRAKETAIKLYKRFKYRYPSKIPTSLPKLKDFIEDVLVTYDLPQNLSHRHAIATMILQMGRTETKIRKKFLADSVVAAQFHECAYAIVQELKESHKKEIEESKQEKLEAKETVDVLVTEPNA